MINRDEWEHEATHDGKYAIASALMAVAEAIHRLGTNNAATEMGAIEALSKELRDGFSVLADAMSEIE